MFAIRQAGHMWLCYVWLVIYLPCEQHGLCFMCI
jgi:hypothetical protein